MPEKISDHNGKFVVGDLSPTPRRGTIWHLPQKATLSQRDKMQESIQGNIKWLFTDGLIGFI
ncbi:MAG: hypothetical protein ABFS56_19150 [Pseudomonadota bacterium]